MKILIYVNNHPVAQRDWPAVPRIGETVAIFNGERTALLKVKNIIWGSLEENWLNYQECEVKIYCK
jgi:hypothetical protein